MVRTTFLAVLFSIAFLPLSFCQKQLVFLNHGNVVARFAEGSYFKCVLKNGQRKEGTIMVLLEFSMIISPIDTIAFQSIKKLERKVQRFNARSGIGGLFFLGGLFYLVIDQANKALGYTSGGFDEGDQRALIVAGVGAALILIKPRYNRIVPGTIMRTIDRTSPFFEYVN